VAISLGPSCPCWRRPAASPPLKLWRGVGAAQEPPWLKADSPSLPLDCATLLTACCPGSPRSCGRRQMPARADHGFDRCTLVVSVQRLLGHTIDNVTLCHHHQASSSYHDVRSPHTAGPGRTPQQPASVHFPFDAGQRCSSLTALQSLGNRSGSLGSAAYHVPSITHAGRFLLRSRRLAGDRLKQHVNRSNMSESFWAPCPRAEPKKAPRRESAREHFGVFRLSECFVFRSVFGHYPMARNSNIGLTNTIVGRDPQQTLRGVAVPFTASCGPALTAPSRGRNGRGRNTAVLLTTRRLYV
jgi:hypothetical protein